MTTAVGRLIGLAAAYAAVYVTVLMSASVLIFGRRNFK